MLVDDVHRRDGLVRAPEHAVPDPLGQPRGRPHRSERSSARPERNVNGVHPGLRARALDDGRGTADVIGVGVDEDEVSQILWLAAKRGQRIKDRGFVTGKTGID